MGADGFGPENDYGRDEVWGNEGIIKWDRILPEEGFAGWEIDKPVWTREGDGILAGPPGDHRHANLDRIDIDWSDFELRTSVTLLGGGALQIRFRRSEQGHYELRFLPGLHALAIARKDPDGLKRLDVVNFPIRMGREYNLLVAARGHSITSYVDGQLVNRVTDDRYVSGGFGFNLWGKRCEARLGNPMVRIYE